MNGREECHGITLERANKEGIGIEDFPSIYKHDKSVVTREFRRHSMIISDVVTSCTMKRPLGDCELTLKGERRI